MVDVGAMAWCLVTHAPGTVFSGIANIFISNVSATSILAGVPAPTEEAKELLHFASLFGDIVVSVKLMFFFYWGLLLLCWFVMMHWAMTSMVSMMVMWWWLVFMHDI